MKPDHSALHQTHSTILNGPGTKADKSRALFAAGVTQKARISELLGGYSVGAIANALAVKSGVSKTQRKPQLKTVPKADLSNTRVFLRHVKQVLDPFIKVIKRSYYTPADSVEYFEDGDEVCCGIKVYEGENSKFAFGFLKVDFGTDCIWWISTHVDYKDVHIKRLSDLEDILGIRY